MVVGQCGKAEDIEVNVCKKKRLTNTRASGSDDALKLTPPKILSLEQALDFIDTDELLEITPKSIRIRKKILDQHFVCVQSVQCSRINLSKTIILKNNVRNPLNLCKIDGFLYFLWKIYARCDKIKKTERNT